MVELSEKYVGEIFYDEDDEATFKVVDVQYDERGETSYYEATFVEVTRGGGGWEIPEGALVDPDSDVIKDADLVGYALVNLTDPENIINYDDVGKMITAHQEREAEQAITAEALAEEECVAGEGAGGVDGRKRSRPK